MSKGGCGNVVVTAVAGVGVVQESETALLVGICRLPARELSYPAVFRSFICQLAVGPGRDQFLFRRIWQSLWTIDECFCG